MKRLAAFFIFAALTLSVHAELFEIIVSGNAEQFGKSNQPGFSVVLVDVAAKDDLVSGILTVPDEFGVIESCVISLFDTQGKSIGKLVLGSQILEKGEKNFEFHLQRQLLQKSIIQISHRKGDDLYVAKVQLGTFPIKDTRKNS